MARTESCAELACIHLHTDGYTDRLPHSVGEDGLGGGEAGGGGGGGGRA